MRTQIQDMKSYFHNMCTLTPNKIFYFPLRYKIVISKTRKLTSQFYTATKIY